MKRFEWKMLVEHGALTRYPILNQSCMEELGLAFDKYSKNVMLTK